MSEGDDEKKMPYIPTVSEGDDEKKMPYIAGDLWKDIKAFRGIGHTPSYIRDIKHQRRVSKYV